MKNLLFNLILLTLLSGATAAMGMTVDLRFRPTVSTSPDRSIQTIIKELQPVRISPFTDSRTVSETSLGEFMINGQAERVQANMPVADYANETFKNLYEEWGGRIAADSRLTLKGEVTHFSFEESEGYQARAGIHFLLLDENDRIIWDGHSTGVIKGGRTITPKTLSGVLSDLLLATFKELFEDRKLTGVWSGQVSSTYLISDGSVNPSDSARLR